MFTLNEVLGEIREINPAEAFTNEVAFSDWLSKNLGRLSDVLGLEDLDLVGVEQPVGDFRCDIVAQEVSSKRIVVIENQFSKTDHDHLGKLLTYAATHAASVVVWISKEVRDEHRAAIDWLNQITREGVSFFAIRLRVITIDESKPAIILDLKAFPNITVKSRSTTSVESPKFQTYRQFFQGLIDQLREKYQFTNAKLAQSQSWYSFSSGSKGFTYGASFAAGRRLRAEVYISVGDKGRNEQAFDWLLTKKEEIEKEFGGVLEWEKLEAKQACRISAVRPDSNVDQLPGKEEELRKWFIDNLLALKKTFGPKLKDASDIALVSQISSEIKSDDALNEGV